MHDAARGSSGRPMLRYPQIHTFKATGYPYLFSVTRETEGTEFVDSFREVRRWCIERFGPQSASPDSPMFRGLGNIHEDQHGAESGRWFASLLCYGFRDEQDAFEFKMRWS